MSTPRGLSAEEAALWAKVAATVTPMAGKHPPPVGEGDRPKGGGGDLPTATRAPPRSRRTPPPLHRRLAASGSPPGTGEDANLDSHWDRKLKAGSIAPDFTLDLHGHSLEAAYTRLMDGLRQAIAMRARVVLLITGKPRPVDPADRAHKRGAIRAKILDWLAASEFSSDIAAVRRSHRRHGGEGALYLVLRRGRG